jgi:Xaa-Pro aminopeptidase
MVCLRNIGDVFCFFFDVFSFILTFFDYISYYYYYYEDEDDFINLSVYETEEFEEEGCNDEESSEIFFTNINDLIVEECENSVDIFLNDIYFDEEDSLFSHAPSSLVNNQFEELNFKYYNFGYSLEDINSEMCVLSDDDILHYFVGCEVTYSDFDEFSNEMIVIYSFVDYIKYMIKLNFNYIVY